MRETDGLIVTVGDAVEFSSDQDDVYLGEVREIYWNEAEGAPVVIAAWYYHPLEAGVEGQRVLTMKGAVFATEHLDENEARCINRRVTVHPSYTKYQENSTPHKTVKERMYAGEVLQSERPQDGERQEDQVQQHQQTSLSPIVHLDIQSDSSSLSSEQPVYFVVGKYDPVHKRVLSWDPDVSRMFTQR